MTKVKICTVSSKMFSVSWACSVVCVVCVSWQCYSRLVSVVNLRCREYADVCRECVVSCVCRVCVVAMLDRLYTAGLCVSSVSKYLKYTVSVTTV